MSSGLYVCGLRYFWHILSHGLRCLLLATLLAARRCGIFALRGQVAYNAVIKSDEPTVKQLTVDLNIPADSYLALYSGAARDVQALTLEGLRVRFPGRILQRFVSREGVCGRFVIQFDDNNKFLAIEKIV